MFNPEDFWTSVGWSLQYYVPGSGGLLHIQNDLYQGTKNPGGVKSILILGGLALWKTPPRNTCLQSVVTNISTGHLTLGVSEDPLDENWTLLSSALMDYYIEKRIGTRKKIQVVLREDFSQLVCLDGRFAPGRHFIRVWYFLEYLSQEAMSPECGNQYSYWKLNPGGFWRSVRLSLKSYVLCTGELLHRKEDWYQGKKIGGVEGIFVLVVMVWWNISPRETLHHSFITNTPTGH